ncbi:uncharacterized protein LOC143017900 [Oratosquilla oratoria]|uniref:uncharacterized protein LOC143017900 n=1 Tax=Oratosquilla oratoria TaxID=337810 RepID=UPI003F75B4E0
MKSIVESPPPPIDKGPKRYAVAPRRHSGHVTSGDDDDNNDDDDDNDDFFSPRLPTLVVVLTLAFPDVEADEAVLPTNYHRRTSRQIPKILDPFGLLGRAGDAVQGTMDHVGKTLGEGAKQVGQIVGDGAQQINDALMKQMSQVQAGVEEAGKVAQIVGEDLVDSVSAIVNKHEENPNEILLREGVFDSVLRIFGVNPNQIGLMALNILIFLAELITSTLISDDVNAIPESRSGEENGAWIMEWIFNGNSPKLNNFLHQAQDPALPRKVIERLVSSTGNETACLQLLVCKISPVVWGVQRSVKDAQEQKEEGRAFQDAGGVFQMMYNSLPQLGDFVKFSESCETQFPACPLLDVGSLGL